METKIPKVVLFGKKGVGKSTFVSSIAKGEFTPPPSSKTKWESLMEQGARVEVICQNNRIVNLWRCIDYDAKYAIGGNLFIYMFDLSSKDSYEFISPIYSEMRKNYPQAHHIVMGNKADLPRFADNIEETLLAHGIEYVEISCAKMRGVRLPTIHM